MKSRKKTKNYFTKLHNSCYNNLYTFLFLIMTPEAERFNGWAAMLGFVAKKYPQNDWNLSNTLISKEFEERLNICYTW